MICKYCDGKGYATEMQGATVGADDFSNEGFRIPGGIKVNICPRCDRGKQIKKYFTPKDANQILVAEMDLLDQIIVWMIGHEGAEPADIADYVMELKARAQKKWEVK